MPGVGVCGAIEWAQYTPELVWGTRDSGGTPVPLEIMAPDAFTIDYEPQEWRSEVAGGTGHYTRLIGTSRHGATGMYRTNLRPSQYVALLGWALGLTSGQLNSGTFDFWDGQQTLTGKGARCARVQGKTDNKADLLAVTFNWIGQDIIPADLVPFNEPAFSGYPADNPFQHTQASGQISVNGTTYTDGYTELGFDITNYISPMYEGKSTISNLDFNGRKAVWTFTREYMSTEFQTLYWNKTPFSASIGWSFPGTPNKVLTLNFGDRNYITARPIVRDWNQRTLETITCEAAITSTGGLPVVFTHSP